MDELLGTEEVGRLAGVGPTAVKRWADEGRLACVRTAGGHRRFLRSEVERFLGIERSSGRRSFVDLLLQADGLGVEARLLTDRSRLGSWLEVAGAVGGALEDLGERWRAGTITVVQEHLASERLSRALARIADALPVAPGAPRCVLACAEADQHALGLSLVEVALREAGWTTLWAGRNTPAGDLAAMAVEGAAEMIAVSASGASMDPAPLLRQAEVLGRACAASGVELALGGGGAWPEVPPHGHRFRSLAPLVELARRVASAHHRDRARGTPDAGRAA